MAPARKKPTIPLSKVPSVKELCEKLGFQHATPRELSGFLDVSHAFRKTYRASDGTPGNELTDWYLPPVQHELYVMALKFLDEAENGIRFWSHTRPWREDSDLDYPEDKVFIAGILKQLFWKQNKYADNNQRYAEKKSNEAREQSRDTPTSRPGTPSTSHQRSLQALPRTSVETTATFGNAQPMSPVIVLEDEERDQMAKLMESVTSSNTNTQRSDIFDVPSDANESRQAINPPIARPNVAPRTPKKVSSPHNTKSGYKRPRIEKHSPKSAKASPHNKSKASKRPLESPSSSSKRRRIATNYPGHLLGEEAEAALEEYDREEISKHERREKRSSKDNETNEEQEDENDLPDLSRPLRLPIVISSPQAPGSTHNTRQHDKIEHAHLEDDITSSSFIAPVAPMTTGSSPRGTGRIFQSLPTPPAQSPFVSQRHPDAPNASDLSAKPKPKVSGRFWILANRQRNKEVRVHWKNGQFKGKTLATVLEEISSFIGSGPIEELDLKLETFFDEIQVSVQKDDEGLWKDTQRDFQKQIKDAFTRDNEQGSWYKIWIKPIYAENAETARNTGDDGDSDDFEW